jgi:hypothetical protein
MAQLGNVSKVRLQECNDHGHSRGTTYHDNLTNVSNFKLSLFNGLNADGKQFIEINLGQLLKLVPCDSNIQIFSIEEIWNINGGVRGTRKVSLDLFTLDVKSFLGINLFWGFSRNV